MVVISHPQRIIAVQPLNLPRNSQPSAATTKQPFTRCDCVDVLDDVAQEAGSFLRSLYIFLPIALVGSPPCRKLTLRP